MDIIQSVQRWEEIPPGVDVEFIQSGDAGFQCLRRSENDRVIAVVRNGSGLYFLAMDCKALKDFVIMQSEFLPSLQDLIHVWQYA